MTISNTNPLTKYFRQPKIYIRLPSSGNFYPPGTIEPTETGEFPVYSMTAKDELLMKTPDALLNGQATVDVIQSCVPNIKNAWALPLIDLDAILVAIRIATNGEMFELTPQIPGVEEYRTYQTDLRIVLDQLTETVYDPEVKIDDSLTVMLRPLNYREFTKTSAKTFEERKILNVIQDENMDEVKKLKLFSESFAKLTDITMESLIASIDKIITPDGIVDNPQFIKEFMDNIDKGMSKMILDHINEQKKKFLIKPFVIKLSEEDQAKGAPEELEIPIVLDGSNFFA